jgi:hypothetical protein
MVAIWPSFDLSLLLDRLELLKDNLHKLDLAQIAWHEETFGLLPLGILSFGILS